MEDITINERIVSGGEMDADNWQYSLRPKKLHEYIGQDGEFTSTFTYPVHLVLFGGGHIAQSLAPLALHCGLAVTVIDDRAETESCFPPSLFAQGKRQYFV